MAFIPLTLSLVPQQVIVGKAALTVFVLHLDVTTSLLELAARHRTEPGLLAAALDDDESPDADEEAAVEEESLSAGRGLEALEGKALEQEARALWGLDPAAGPPSSGVPPTSEQEALHQRASQLIDNLPAREQEFQRKQLAGVDLPHLPGYVIYLEKRVGGSARNSVSSQVARLENGAVVEEERGENAGPEGDAKIPLVAQVARLEEAAALRLKERNEMRSNWLKTKDLEKAGTEHLKDYREALSDLVDRQETLPI